MRIHDISPLITDDLHVWPGDTPPSREVLLDIARGDNLTLSTLRSSVHLGAHADAPSHYGAGGATIERMPLETYIGPCQVLHASSSRGERLGPEVLPDTLDAPRVLFRTYSYIADGAEFDRDFCSLSPELIRELARRGACLVGVDTPSVDSFESKALEAHHACLECGIAIVEGLVLEGVPQGVYELICPPLKLRGFDASPVRALLREYGAPVSRSSR